MTGRDAAEVAILFLRLGFTAFGGPAAHIALMQQEVVVRRRWLNQAQFLDLLGAANLIPGPSSTELAIFLGFNRAGWLGLLLAGACFILPASLMVCFVAWAYVHYGRLPQIQGILYGVKPVVVAVIVQALWNLGRTAVKSRLLALVATAATAAGLFAVNPLLTLFAAGLAGLAVQVAANRPREGRGPLICLLALIAVLAAAPMVLGWIAAPRPFGLSPLFLTFLKLGSIVYGSGYVLLAFLRADLVTQRGWINSAQLLDAVAVGQITPGPVFTTATFIGYVLAGAPGAAAATAGIFLPAFLLVIGVRPLISRLRKSALTGAFLDGINVASLGLMAAVTTQFAREAVRTPLSVGLMVAAAIMLLRLRVNASWLLLAGALAGMVYRR